MCKWYHKILWLHHCTFLSEQTELLFPVVIKQTPTQLHWQREAPVFAMFPWDTPLSSVFGQLSLQVQVVAHRWDSGSNERNELDTLWDVEKLWVVTLALDLMHRLPCPFSPRPFKGNINGTTVFPQGRKRGSLSFCLSPSISLSLYFRDAMLCLFLWALQSLPHDCPCHMELWPHSPVDVFVAERHSRLLRKNTQLMRCMLRQQFFFLLLSFPSWMREHTWGSHGTRVQEVHGGNLSSWILQSYISQSWLLNTSIAIIDICICQSYINDTFPAVKLSKCFHLEA